MTDTPDPSFLAAALAIRPSLRVHCYRMLGSSHDAEDFVQETLLRAWRARSSLGQPELMRRWLYRIATNVCLDELRARPRRVLATDRYPPADPTRPPADPVDEPIWLEPMPDRWLEGVSDPEGGYALKESIALAFVAALQRLSPTQRATLLLRDVVGLSADETAEALSITVSAANSALFRARHAVQADADADPPSFRPDEVDDAKLDAYVEAFVASDIPRLVALLHHDVKTTMPPRPTWIAGREELAVFFGHMMPVWASPVRIVRTRANGQRALAFYRLDPSDGTFRFRALEVLAARDDRIVRIDHFLQGPAIASIFELPDVL